MPIFCFSLFDLTLLNQGPPLAALLVYNTFSHLLYQVRILSGFKILWGLRDFTVCWPGGKTSPLMLCAPLAFVQALMMMLMFSSSKGVQMELLLALVVLETLVGILAFNLRIVVLHLLRCLRKKRTKFLIVVELWQKCESTFAHKCAT